MYIAQIFSIILLSFGAAALYLGISAMRRRYREFVGNIVLSILCFSSSLWCYGFGILFLTDNTKVAYWGRTIGMIGVMAFLILAQVLVGILGNIPKKLYLGFCIFASLGVIIYFFEVAPQYTTYYMGDWGMTYTFMPGIVSNIYSAYSVIYGINMFISVQYIIRHAENKRSKVNGQKLLITLIIVFLGMMLDTVFPMFGFAAIPGSSISQFIGLLVIYYAIVDYNKTRLTALNMSQYVYSFVSEPMLVFNNEGHLKLMNRAAEDIFPSTYDTLGKNDINIDDIFMLPANHFDFTGNHRSDNCASVADNISVQIQTNRIYDKYGDCIGYILTIKDMTRINEMMQSLVEAKQLAEANNLAKSTFLAKMSHEIRTPLNAIIGFSELLLNGDISAKDRELVDDIRSSSHNLLAIINDILDISKIESGKMELREADYQISDVIKDACLITNTIAQQKGLEFIANMDENIPAKLFGDHVRIRGIFVNILNNAVKYTKTGSVRFEGFLEKIEGDIAQLEFTVTDTGIGIKTEDKEKLFESFSQFDKKENRGIEGTGLGLAIVKGFMDLMGGTVEVASTYGKGSKFILRFSQRIVDKTPMGNIQMSSAKTNSKSSISENKFTGIKVLAVDDNNINLKVISRCLEKYEMDVTTAKSGAEAIELCQNNDYRIVLMDQMMPEMDGIEAMKEIRKISPHYAKNGNALIVALTANAISGVREELISVGFDDYLSKPIEFARMEEIFRKMLIGKD